jgi:hypothetical protein
MAPCTDLLCVLEEKLPEMLEKIPLAQQDCAHLAHQGQERLIATYNNCWIELGRPVAWPSRLLNLTPRDFSLLGHITALIYMSPVDSE